MRFRAGVIGSALVIAASSAAPAMATSARPATPADCPIYSNWNQSQISASTTASSSGVTLDETLTITAHTDFTNFVPTFALSSHGNSTIAPDFTWSVGGGSAQDSSMYYDGSGENIAPNIGDGNAWSATLPEQDDLADGSSLTLQVALTFTTGMPTGNYSTWFTVTGLTCDDLNGETVPQETATLNYTGTGISASAVAPQ